MTLIRHFRTGLQQFLATMIISFAFLAFSLATVRGQDITPFYVCVIPRDGLPSYVMTFQRSSIFGLTIPIDADVIVYSSTPFATGLYTINTDAQTGGYIAVEYLLKAQSASFVPIENDCRNQDEYSELLSTSTETTIPIPISVNHMLLIEAGHLENSRIVVSPPVLGVLAFSFDEVSLDLDEATTVSYTFQFLQISEADPGIEFSVPFIPAGTRFTLIANKTYNIGQSQPGQVPPEFPPNLSPSNPRSFIQDDLSSLYNVDMFDLMENNRIRIYPDSGTIEVYRGAFFRLSIPPQVPERGFVLDGDVQGLEGTKALTVAANSLAENPLRINAPFETPSNLFLQDTSTAAVSRIETDTGQLFVHIGNAENLIQSWLVEPIQNQ